VMSERQTGVGLGGSRLGILNKTAPIAGHCTRLLIEYGAHSNRADFAIHRSEAFYEAAGRATAEAFAAFLGLPLAVVEAQAPPPEVAPWQPGGVAVTVPGTGREYWIVEPILSHYRLNGALARYGWPLSGLYTETEGEARGLAVQYFERARLEVQPDGTVTEGRLGAELLAARASES